jgi:hypothetical protein
MIIRVDRLAAFERRNGYDRPCHGLTLAGILIAVARYVITRLGMTVGFHRLFTMLGPGAGGLTSKANKHAEVDIGKNVFVGANARKKLRLSTRTPVTPEASGL